VYYRVDGGAWVLVDAVDGNGPQEVILNAVDGHVVGRKLELKFVLHQTTGVTVTPKMKMPIILKMMVMPLGIDAYHEIVSLKASEKLRNGLGKQSEDGYAVLDKLNFLMELRNTAYPILRIDELGRFYTVKITDLAQDMERHVLKKGVDVSIAVSVRTLDLNPGIQRQMDTKALTITDTYTSDTFLWTDFMGFGVASIGLATCDG
jgi:hypothetical protein